MSDVATIEKTESQLDKSAIREFAVNARRKLKEKVELQANKMGFFSDGRAVQYEFEDDNQVKINGEFYNKSQINILKKEIASKTFDSVIDEVAYTWFNRFIALYYMEHHDYIDNGLKIIQSIDNLNQTAIKCAGILKNIDKESLFKSVQDNDSDAVYKKLVIAQCNELNSKLPFLFEEISNYTELLFPSGMMNNDSVIREMLTLDNKNWDEVEIIGWLYQYYIAEKKEEVVGLNKGTIDKEDIPAATQLFTPKWIVKYMVQNSLGKFYSDMYPNNNLIENWEYYLKSQKDENTKSEILSPEDITFIDPCCGSGHILVYAFEVFYQIYKNQGYLDEEIPNLILTKNLRGLDICKRAVQLANFALTMKARSYTKNIDFIKPQIIEIIDSVTISENALDLICKNDLEKNELKDLIDKYRNAKCFGSLIKPENIEIEKYIESINNIDSTSLFKSELTTFLLPVLKEALVLSKRYTIVVTNPPFLNKYNSTLKEFIFKNYKDYKEDLYSAFIFKCSNWSKENGYTAMMSPMTWMFISSHQALREHILKGKVLSSLVRPEYHAFYSSAHVPICTFVIKNRLDDSNGVFIDLNKYRGEDLQPILVKEAVKNPNIEYRYEVNSKKFAKIDGTPISYMATDKVREIFSNNDTFYSVAQPRQGLATADNDRFLRYWNEVVFNKIGFDFDSLESANKSNLKWFPYNKGGNARKWYGNNEYVVNWEHDGYEIKNNIDKNGKLRSRPQNVNYYFKKGLTWILLSSSYFSVRYQPNGFIFDVNGMSAFPIHQENLYYLLGFMSSKLSTEFLKIINDTMAFQIGDISKLPIQLTNDDNYRNKVNNIVQSNIDISKDDWDSFETSWDFETHPLLRFCKNSNKDKWAVNGEYINTAEPITMGDKIEDCFKRWKEYKQEQFNKLKSNEEELNRLFIEIYGLQDEMTPEVADKDITVSLADETREIKSLLSYAVGCMLGRYSLDKNGLAFAGGTFDSSNYKVLEVDEDGILPILSDTWFEDDIIEELKRFLSIAFGEVYKTENLNYIAKVLKPNSSESAETIIRNYFLKDFYKDHLQIYKKRPIYWMFTSGKEKAFNCLVYLHRYDKTTISRIRKDYLHEFQAKLDRAIAQAEDEGNVKLTSLYAKYKKELQDYDSKIKDIADAQIELDLDDGVKVNYAKFKGLLEAEKDIVGKEK